MTGRGTRVSLPPHRGRLSARTSPEARESDMAAPLVGALALRSRGDPGLKGVQLKVRTSSSRYGSSSLTMDL